MAEPAKSVITLTTGGSIATPETTDQLKTKVLHGSDRPFIEVSDLVGGIHLVAVDQIVEIAPSGA